MYASSKLLAFQWNGTNSFTVTVGKKSIVVRPLYATSRDADGLSDLLNKAHEHYRRPVYIMVDGHRWDATQGIKLLKLKLAWYQRMGIESNFADALQELLVLVGRLGFGDSSVAYNSDGTVRSGDPDTSSGNSFINILIHVYMLLELGCEEADIWALGDDNLIIAKSFYVNADMVTEVLKTTGIVPVVNVSHNINEMEFCSARFYPTSKGLRMGPKIGRFLARMGWSIQNITLAPKKKSPEAYHTMVYKATLEALQKYVSHVPFVRVYVSVTLKQLEDTYVSAEVRKTVDLQTQFTWTGDVQAEATADTWAMVEEIYGLTPTMERHFKSLLQSSAPPSLINWDVIDRIVRIDT